MDTQPSNPSIPERNRERAGVLSTTGRRGSLFSTSTLLVMALVCGVYGWLAGAGGLVILTETPSSFYSDVTEGFVAGQTSMKTLPDPRLAELENPWSGLHEIPRWHDATYFQGRYYLYFGPAPVVLLTAPWRVLTGTHLTDQVVVLIFCLAGFVLGAAAWLRVLRRYCPEVGQGWINVGLLVWGLGSLVPHVAQAWSVYCVPIACAFALLMAGVSVLLSAQWDERNRVVWLGLAGLMWGLMVAARPNYLLTLPVLGVAAGVFSIQAARRARSWANPAVWKPLMAVVLPPLAIGLCLACYNHARFGDFTETGFRYQFTAGDQRNITIFTTRVWGNFQSYILSPCHWRRYYPFVSREGSFGVLGWTPFALLGLMLPLTWLSRTWRGNRGWVWIGAVVLSIALVQFYGLISFTFAAERYALDFVPALTFTALLVLAVLARSKPLGGWAALGAAVLALASTVPMLLYSMSEGRAGAQTVGLGKLMNYPAHWAERAAGTTFGPIAGEITFVPQPAGVQEPLVVSSHGRDLLFAEWMPGNRIRFAMLHLGAMTPYSEPVAVEPGRPYSFAIDLGALYPPAEHPLFDGQPRNLVDALLRRVRVVLDGNIVLDSSSSFYPSSPALIEIGTNRRGIATTPRFAGKLTGLKRLGIPESATLAAAAGEGPVQLSLKFPAFRAVYGEPLVSTGRPPDGDLIFVTYLAPGRLRLGHDSLRGGAIYSRSIAYDPDVEHQIQVATPALDPGRAKEGRGPVEIWFDGKRILSGMRSFGASTALDTVFGYNAVRASSASALFTGPSFRVARIGEVPTVRKTITTWGPQRLTLLLPLNRVGANEPVLTTGVSGRGDSLYVRYLAPDRIQFGYDHWGVGGILSEPVPLEPHANIQLEVSVGALYPPDEDPWWAEHAEIPRGARGRVFVRYNDQVILNAPFGFHPSTLEALMVGKNSIGTSTSEPAFLGEIQSVEPIELPLELR